MNAAKILSEIRERLSLSSRRQHLATAANRPSDRGFEHWVVNGISRDAIDVPERLRLNPESAGLTDDNARQLAREMQRSPPDGARALVDQIETMSLNASVNVSIHSFELLNTLEIAPQLAEAKPLNVQAYFNPGHGGYFRNLTYSGSRPMRVSNATIHRASIVTPSPEVMFQDCQIGTLSLQNGNLRSLRLLRCRVGSIEIDPPHSLHNFDLQGCHIHRFSLPTTGHKSIHGDVTIRDCTFPTIYSDLLPGRAHGYTAFRANLEDLQNAQATHLMRGIEGEAQQAQEVGLFKWVLWLHGATSEHGLKPMRPLALVAAVAGVIFALSYITDGAVVDPDHKELFSACSASQLEIEVSFDVRDALGWRLSACDAHRGNLVRSSLLAMQKIFNPLGIFNKEALVMPRGWWLTTLTAFQDMWNVLMYFYFFFAIRRRFRL